MGGFDFYSAIKDFGFPVAIAAVLVWNLLSLNKKLSASNDRLMDEIAKMRDILGQQAIQIEQQTRLTEQLREILGKQAIQIEKQSLLVEQNETLVNAMQERERQSFKLVETFFSVRLESERLPKEVQDGRS